MVLTQEETMTHPRTIYSVVIYREGGPDDCGGQTDNPRRAIVLASDAAAANRDAHVFVRVYRESDGLVCYLNPTGYDVEGVSWSE
jgi:mRNA-degrading endonuclease toxin of MazEF toxin-antitoxin module